MSTSQNTSSSAEDVKRKELETSIRKRVELERQAYEISNRLIDTGVAADYLLNICNLISPSHYEDVVEERAISKLCGYPLCDNILKSVPKHKYHISTKSNKVYDISERKNFCSNQCFKASEYFKNQISTSPLWVKKNEPPVNVQLLKTTRGLIGAEVIGSPETKTTLKQEVEQLHKLDSISSNSEKIPVLNKTQPSPKTEKQNSESGQDVISESETNNIPQPEIIKHNLNTSSDISQLPQPEIIKHNLNTSADDVTTQSKESKSDYMLKLLNKNKHRLSQMTIDTPINVSIAQDCTVTAKSLVESKIKPPMEGKSKPTMENKSLPLHDRQHSQTTEKKVELSNNKVKPVHVICDIIKQWFTLKSQKYLNKQNEMTLAYGMEDKYAMLCHRLEHKEREKEELEDMLEHKLKISEEKNHNKPLPDYQDIKEEVRMEEIKVREFYRGNFYTDKDLKESEKDYTEEDKAAVVMPTVDSNDQMMIRRRIVLEKIMKVMPDVLSPLNLSIFDVSEEIRELIQTFSFTNLNILCKPAQWTLVGIIILKLISRRKPELSQSFEQPVAVKFFNIILTGLGETMESLDKLISSIHFAS